jgi:hypothetical protein
MLIFHHIPKTAGTSLVQLLAKNHPGERLFSWYEGLPDPSRWWRDWYAGKSADVRCVASHTANHLIPVLVEDRVPFQVITLLRNPLDRCLSLYHFLLELARAGENDFGGRAGRFLLERSWSLDDIYRHADDPVALALFGGFFNGQTRAILRPQGIPLPTSREPRPEDRARLREAIPRYDIGTVESYRETLDRWATRFSWRSLSYEATNVTRSRREAPPPSPQTLELIRAYNQLDLELYASHRRPSAR